MRRTSSQSISVQPLPSVPLPVEGVAMSGDPKATTLTPPGLPVPTALVVSSTLLPKGDQLHREPELKRVSDDVGEAKNLPRTRSAKAARMSWMTRRGPPRRTRVETKPSSVRKFISHWSKGFRGLLLVPLV